MDTLREYLAGMSPGPITHTGDIESHLAACWDDLDGSSEGGMEAEKLLGRMERVVWGPPILSFVIERHGGTVNGSTRAELQHWTVDLDAATATLAKTDRRQLRGTASRFTTAVMREMAEELAGIIERGEEDDRLDWKGDGRVHVVVTEMIGGGFERTVAGRRKRMRAVLEDVLGRHGWVHEDRNVFRRVSASGPDLAGRV